MKKALIVVLFFRNLAVAVTVGAAAVLVILSLTATANRYGLPAAGILYLAECALAGSFWFALLEARDG